MMENNDNISKLYGALNKKYFGPQKLNISEDDFRSYLNKEQGAADSIYKYLDDEDKAAMGNDVNNLRAYISDGMKASASPIAKPAPVQSQGNKAATPKPSLSFFDRAKTAWENAIGGDEQTIRDGETPDEAAHRIANEQGTPHENAAYELAKRGYQQAGKGRPTAYSYTQNFLAKHGIATSDPESEGHRDLVNGTNRFAADVAQRTVDDIMSRITPQSSDPVQELQDNYYSRDVLNRVWIDADRLGFEYNDYLNLFVRPQLEKSMVAKYGKELGQRARGIFDNYEGTYNEIENREVAADMRRSLAPSIKEAIDSAWNDTHKTVGGFGLDRYRSGKRANISATTGHIDYDALEKSLSDNVDGMLSHILHDKQSMSRWAKRAAERNMSLQDYMSEFVVPQVQNEVMHEFERYATEKNTPQNAIDYLKAKLNNSLTMSLVNTFRNTESENRYQSQGLAEVEAGRGAYKPSTVTRAAGLGAEMAPDFWMWAGWGRVGAEAGQAMLESRISTLAAEKGLSLNAARLQVENEAKHYLGERAKQYLLHSIPSSAITMAGASATGQLGADIRDRKSVSKAIDDYFSTFGHSLGTGAAFGAVGATSRALTAPLAGLKKVLGKAVSFGATVATLDATENGMSAITGDNKESAIDKLIRAGWNQIAMDLSSKSPMETIRKVQHLFSTPISDTLRNSMKSTEMPGTLSASQLQEVNNSAEGQNLKASLDILLDAKRAKKSDVIDLSNSFDRFMQSSDIRCTTKKAVADMLDAPYQLPLETDAEIIPNDDGTGTVTVRFTGSKGEHVDDMLFPTQGDAESFLANSEDKFEHNKALENWDASNEQQRMSAIAGTLKADGKPFTQDNVKSVLDAFKNGTESKKFRDSLEKALNPANRYGYDEQSRNKGYNTKTEEAYAVVDAFNSVTSELRGIKGLWNIMMQKEATEALPIIEKEYGMEVAQKAAQWYNGREAYDGIVSAAKDRATASAQQLYDAAVPMTYKQNGDDIVTADVNGEQVFIINSTKDLFAMLDTGEDGIVDVSVNGDVRSIRLSQLDNVTRSSNKQKYEENLATFEEQEMNKVSYAPGTPDIPQIDDVYYVNGNEYRVIGQPDENGQMQYFKVPTADGKAVGNPEPIDINEYKQAKSDELLGKLQEQPAQQEGAPKKDAQKAEKGNTQKQPANEEPENNTRRAIEEARHGEGKRQTDEEFRTNIADADGNVTPITLSNGMRAFVKDGDPENQLGIVTIAYYEGRNLKFGQVYGKDVQSVGETIPLEQYNKEHGEVPELPEGFKKGDEIGLSYEGNNFKAEVVGMSDNGKMVLRDSETGDTGEYEPGVVIDMKKKYEQSKDQMPMREDGEEDWQATTPERAHDYIFNEAGLSRSEGNEFISAQIKAAQSALAKAKSSKMPKVGTSIKKYHETIEKRQEKIDEAQRMFDYWQKVRDIQNGIQREENERRRSEQAALHDEAVIEEQQRQEKEIDKREEQAQRGAHAVHPAIRDKWEAAPKIEGAENEITLANGERVKGRYMLVESGVATPSHNPTNDFTRNDGFPVDENGQTVNDRDYERDKDAQDITRLMAANYDSRAIQSVPVVSNDGVVLSGNGRTMAGELAARDNTDGAYIEHLKKYPQQFGFTREQVEGMQHPRVLFVPDEAMPYTTDTFAKFNQQDMKSQSRTEQSVKLGKTVDDATFGRIIQSINAFDSLNDFYQDATATTNAIGELRSAGVINTMQYAEMFDGEKVSGVGRQMLENMLIGKAFESNPDAIRQLSEFPAMRQSVISALAEITNNIKLGEEYSVEDELAGAISLVYQARKSGTKAGEPVSWYARQLNLFPFDMGETVADYTNATVLMLADQLNGSKINQLKNWMAIYNHASTDAANGQLDIFSGGIKSKQDIVKEALNVLNYGTDKEKRAALDAAREQRKSAAEQSRGSESVQQASVGDVSEQANDASVVAKEDSNAVRTAVAEAEADTNTEPTEAQKEAGNYKKGHVKVDGMDVTIEQPRGSIRRGTDANGKHWEQEMHNTYGYIRGTEGVDGDHIDVFLSDDPSHGDVFVVDQVNKDGSFDEHKVMYGFPDIESARKAYLSNYEEGWQGLGAITPVSKEEFKKWIDSSHRKTKPFAEYSSVKPLDDAQHREYTIEETSYTNKRGKTTPMHFVTFSRELSKEEIRAGKELAKKSRGWWDAKQGGFMMRSEESAKELADALGNDDAVQDAQPLSVDDVATVNDRADLKAIDDTFKVDKREPQKTQQDTPQYDGEREENVYDKTLTGLRNVINDRKHGAIPSIKNIEKVIRDLRKRAKTIEDGMATAAGDTISQAFDALADLNGKRRAYEQFLTDIRTKMADTEREDALAAHGVKLGDKVIYKGNECTIHDANNGQVTLDIGLGPVVYEVADWKDVEIPKHAKESQKFEQKQSKQEELPKSKWVNDEDADRFEELRKRLREKLRGQVNMGVDPEVFAIGVEMSYLMLKKGARKFNEFAKNLIDALGEEVRPYIKAFYNGARDLPEMEEYEKDMTPYEEVRKFDLLNFGKNEKDLVKKIEHIAQENEVMRQAEEAKNKIKKERNEARKEAEQEIATNTEVIASKAETLAGEAESKLASARNERELNGITRKIDDTIDEVNDQLALLGYYEADPVDRDYNEAYGYMRNAEKKVVKNVTALFKTLTKELGIEDPVVYNAKGKKQKSVTANIAPAGGDVSMRIMLNRDKDVELYIDFMLDPDGDNLKLKDIMYRPERNRNSLGSNNFFPADVTVQQMLSGIRRVCKPWLSEESPKIIKNSTKGRNSQKKTLSLQQIPDLFSGLFDNNKLNDESDDTATTRQAENGSRTDRKVGSVSAVRDRVLGTNGTRQADGEGLAEISKSSEPVADGKRTGISGRRSSGSSERGNNLSGEAEQKLSYRGRSLRNGNGKDGGDANRATSTEAGGVQNREEGTDRGAQRRLAQRLEPRFKHNYTYPENSSEIDNMTPQQRMTANVEALEVLRNLMRDGREATPEEKEILGRYRGWGGVNVGMAYSTSYMRRSATDVFGRNTSEGNKLLNRLADVIDELDPDGERGILSSINRAALTSYYTPTEIAKTMNNFIKLAGFNGGSYLDPSMGNGVFEGTMPKDIQQRTMIHGVELDWLTGQIAKNLYPDANVQITGYEQAGTADNAYDVVVSNIPFGDISVNDKSWKHDSSPVRKAAQNRIHNYFAVKMLDNTRPGGLCVIMTSNAILDTKGNQIIREHLADHAEILGVVRLPDNTFKGAGTKVVTDVLFLRKFKDDVDRTVSRNDEYINNIEKPFLSSSELKLVNSTDGKTYSVSVNGYFDKHKNMMIGEAKAGGQYRADQFGLSSDLSTDDLAKKMNKLIEKNIVGNRSGQLFDTHKTKREVHQAISEAYKGNGNYISSGNIVEQDGKIGIMTSTKNKYGDVTSTFTEMPSLNSKLDRIRAILPIRTAMKRVIDWQIQGEKENRLVEARSELQKAYDNFVNDYGRLNDKENDFLTEDIDGYTIRSLERMKAGKFDGLSDIFTKNTIKPAIDITSVKTATDAISLSLAEYGEINPAYMEDVLGSSWADQCGETIFKTPFSDSYETADAYLSGDVKTKLEQAKKAAQEDKAFEKNVAALEKIQPKDIPFEDINIRMGARWIPSEVYTDFMYDMFGIYGSKDKNGVKYIPEVDQYVLNINKSDLGGQADAWRTDRRSASEIFMAALQDKTLTAYDSIERGDKTQKAVNKDETKLLNDKVQELRTAFEDWIGQDPERQDKLMRLYNDKFNRNVLRKFDGSHLNVAGLMGKELRPHQKDAVWMLINNRGGIVDHIVGAGKTLVMQSAIMEMRRMGIAKKPMIIALKATVSQIAKEFHEAYPAARILYPSEKDFAKNNRKKFMSQIALNDYDCVILSHDQYCMLPHTDEVERSVINEQKAQLDAAIEYLYGQNDKGQLTKKQLKGLERRKLNLEAKLDKLSDRKVDKEFTFESLGVDYLFVDECQHFKSLPYVTTYDRVAGLGAKDGSQRAVALLNGVRYLQKMHQGDQGTIFLSGTTISNSLSEIYNLMNYLRPSEMQRLGLTTFDAWASNFAKHTAEIEYGVTNELKEKDRFRSLTNIPELSKMYAEIADVRNDMNLQLPKPKMKSHIVTVPQSDAMKKINDEIINMVKSKNGSYFGIEAKDNTPWGLLASTLSAKVAINPRLIDETLSEEGGKIPYVCENVKKIYDKFKNQKGTQLIFCDTGVSGKGKAYDAYSDIINRLVNDYGIPRKEIADIHEANTDEKRKALFSKVNDGSVRILLGGTKNMGTGVNVQKRIVAMHHVDVPWTPADREQREGRGVRQGNEIAKNFNDNNVDVYFYAAVGSLDMYKYQLQETKGKLFTQFKSGTVGDRTFDEGDADGDFDAAEVVATLSGNPVIFEKSKQDKKVDNLLRSKRAYENDWRRRKLRYDELQNQERNFNRLIRINAQDARGLEKNGFIADADGKYPTTVTVSVKDNRPSRMTFDKPKEAGAYIHKLLKDGKQIILSGFGQTATVIRPITSEGLFEKPIAQMENLGGIRYKVEVSDDDTAAGVAFRNLLQKVYSNKDVYERKLSEAKKQLVGADPGEDNFPKQAELDAAIAEQKRLNEEYQKLSDESHSQSTTSNNWDDPAVYRIREDVPPTKTGVGYKVFVLKDGKLYPPMVANPGGEATPVGVWLDADAAPVVGTTKTGRQQVKAGGKGTQGGSGKLAYRPGWHLGTIPYALQFNRVNPETGERELFPANFVWAKVEYADDVNYQKEAMSYGMKPNGKFQHSLAGLPRLPKDGSYMYRTNPDPRTDPWVITGAMKVDRILKPSEVDAIVRAAGREPQKRQEGAVTDEQVEALNREIKRTMSEDNGMMRKKAEQMGEKLNTKVNIIDDVNSITHPNEEIQSRRRNAKGWYDTKTGQVNVVISNNESVDDVASTIAHEVIAHKGLRELVGKENYDNFLDEVYDHLRDDLKTRVDSAAKRFMANDTSRTSDQHRRTAVDELFGQLAEKPFDEFSDEEKTLWGKIKDAVRNVLDKFLGSLKLPKDFELGDDELRYVLQRSKEKLENRKGVEKSGYMELDSSQTGDDLFRVMNTPDKRLHGATRAEVETAGRRTAEKLGGSKIEFVDSVDAPDEVRSMIDSGKNVKGWYDPNSGKVYVLKDKAKGKEDVQHTIFHEKLGHEGLSALLGGQEAVNKFGNFIYLSADANLRDLINKKAKELGKSALDKDGMSIAAQEVFADIAENGPRSAEEFNIWRKVKYYLIQAAKKMGITFHGMLNDDDMRYYVLKTGEALKHWDNMDATTKEDIQYPSMYRETYTDDKGNKHDMPPKPRKKKNESFMNFKNRMEEWEKKSEALKDESDPIPAEFNMDTDKEAQDEWNDIMESWKERHGLIGEQPESIPDRAIGQSDEDYLSSIKNYEKWSEAAKDKDDPMPDMFDFLGKKQDEYYKRYYDWKARHQIADEMNTDLAIYGNATEKYLDKGGVIDEQYHLLEDEKTPEEKDLTEKVNEDIIHEIGDSLGVDTSPEGVKKIVKYSVIDRRKDLESMNAENAIEIHNIDKDITEVAKQMGIKPEDLSKALVLDLEHDRRLSDIAKSLNSSLTFILGHIRPLTKEDIEAVEPLLRELAELDKNRDEADPIPEEVETKAAQIATKLNSLSTKLPEIEMEKARKRAEAKHDRVLAGISQLLNDTQTFVQNHLTITPADLLHVESKLEKLRFMVAGIGDGIRTAPMNDLASEIARAINDLHKGDKGFVPISGEELMDVLPVLTRNTKVPMEEQYAPYFGSDILATLDLWKQPLGSGLDYDKEKVLPIMQKIRSWYDQFYSLLADAGLKRDDTGFVHDYVNHMWNEDKSDPNAYQAISGENFQRKNSRNMKKREISTYLEGISLGLVPRFDKITDLMAFYGTENAQAIANRRMLDDLAGVNVLETNSDGEVVNKLPLLTTHQPNALEIEKYSYYKVPGIGALWCYNGGGKVIKGIKVSGGVDSRFGTVFGQLGNPADHSSQNVLWHLYDLAADTAKKIQLSLSGFHAGALTEVYIAQGLSQFGPTKTVKNLMRYLVNPALHGELPGYSNPDDFKMAAKHLVKLGATDDYAASEVEALSEKFKNFWTNLRKEAEKKGAAGKIAGVGITVPEFASAMLDFVNKGTDKILWDYLHDGLKIASFKMFSDDINKRFSMGQFDSVKREQLLDEAGQYVNDMFGGQYWELINVSPKFLKGLRRIFLSPDWLISTNRHFLGTFGFGSLYSESSMKNYLKFNIDNLKRAFGADIEKDYNRSLRSKASKLCYGVGVLLFYQLAANALNAYMRKTDQQNEAEKAAKDPNYVDKYKLAYPDGMKWYDYLMYSNASGKGTHIFGGRYKDGKEMYIRWGKQFREFPEMFFDDNWHLSFPAQIWERMFTKANPMIHLVSDLTGFYSDYNNTAQDEEIKSKYGKEVGTLVKLINYYLPYSLNTQDNKEFRMTDLVFPSSKGYNNHKAQDDFKKYIMNGDTPGISKTYQNCILNGINPQLQMKAAIASIKADTKTEMNDGITDLGTAKEAFEKAKTVEEKKNYKNKILKYLANENYGDYSMQNAIDEAKDILTGQAPNKESNDVYISKATYQDVLDDYRLSSIRTKVKKHTDIINDLRETDPAKAKAYYDSHRKWFEIDNVIKKANKQINAYKKLMKKGKGDASTMNKIREVRTKALRELEGLNPTMYK